MRLAASPSRIAAGQPGFDSEGRPRDAMWSRGMIKESGNRSARVGQKVHARGYEAIDVELFDGWLSCKIHASKECSIMVVGSVASLRPCCLAFRFAQQW